MKVFQGIVNAVTAAALAVLFVGAGFLTCVAPPVTHALSNFFSDDVTSPFTRAQLTQVAEATRDYSFGAHDRLALYQTVYEVDLQYRQQIVSTGGQLPYRFPELDAVKDTESEDQFAAVFADASEMYCFSPATVAHLDDCNKIASAAYPALIAFAIVAVAGLVFTGATCGKRRVGGVLVAAGITVLVALAALGAWAAIDFTGFFAAFHGLFFSQGNWVFPYDSLLICALPQQFWVGMGVTWLVVSVVVSAASVVVGRKLRKR